MQIDRDMAERLAGELATAHAGRPMIADSRRTVERPWGWGLTVTHPLDLVVLGHYLITKDVRIFRTTTLVSVEDYVEAFELLQRRDLTMLGRLHGWWKTRGVAKSISRVRLEKVVADLPIDSLAGELMVRMMRERPS